MLPISRSARLCVQVLSLIVGLALSTGMADAQRVKRAHPLRATVTMHAPPAAQLLAGGSWHAVTPVPAGSFQGGAGAIMQLTDGRVLVHDNCTSNWWTLTPNAVGSYINGSWKQVASLPAGYAPLYFSSAVLPDGRVIMNGGEYNDSGSGCKAVWTNLGAIYDPVRNTWTAVAPPSGWNSIGDSQNVVMPDGSYVLANCCALFGGTATDQDMAQLDAKTLTWTSVPHTGKVDANDEEGWTLMPDGSLLTVDASGASSTASHAERYYNASWHDAGNLIKLNADFSLCGENASYEVGPKVLLPTGKVLAVGATQHTALYTPGATLTDTGTWAAGPDFPTISPSTHPDGEADGPAALLPSGNVLLMASPCVFQTPSHFYEYNGSSLTRVSEPPNAPNDSSYYGRLMTLPTGEVLLTDYSSDIEIYRPRGRPRVTWKPVITSFTASMTQGKRYRVVGKRFNGLSQASNYGDDSQSATNYPLVRITNTSSGRVTYGRTFGFSSMGVAVAGRTSAVVQIPARTPTGPSTMEVVANGIASSPVAVTIVARTPTAVADEQ